MDTKEILLYAKKRVLQTPAYRGEPGFPEEVADVKTLSDLLMWLGNAPFASIQNGDAAATIELLTILASLDPGALPRLLEHFRHLSDRVMAPGRKSIQEVEIAVALGNVAKARHLTGRVLSWEVKRWRPQLRWEVAAWIVQFCETL